MIKASHAIVRRRVSESSYAASCRRLLFDRLEDRRMLAGDLDPSFDVDGRVTTDLFSNSDEQLVDIALQADGKIVALGYTTSTSHGQDFALVRYNTNGTVDTSFGIAGKVTTDFETSGHDDSGARLAIQPDGKIVAVGGANDSLHFAVARYNGDGTPDATFDGDGKRIVDVSPINGTGFEEGAHGVALQADGKIVMAGFATMSASNRDFAIVRLNSDGSLDSSFDGDGIATVEFTLGDAGIGVSVVGEGKIIVSGRYQQSASNYDFSLLRLNANGSLDTGFGTSGIVTTDIGTASDDYGGTLAVQGDGKVVMVGDTTSGIAVVRYSAEGVPDNSFDTDGKVVLLGIDSASDIALEADGKIVVVGRKNLDFAVARFNNNGTPDPSFGSAGLVYTDFGGTEIANSVAVQADGKVIAAGYHRPTGQDQADFALARYQSNLSPIAAISGPAGAIPGQTRTFAISAADSAADQAIGFTYQVNFGDGSPTLGVPASANNGTGVTVNHIFNSLGSFTVSVTATDQYGAISTPATLVVNVTSVAIQPDDCHAGQTQLVVGGTTQDDVIVVSPVGNTGTVEVSVNSASQGTFIPTGRIVIYSLTGNDDVQIAGSIGLSSWLYGGAGDDRLKGGNGHDVLLGEAGSDLLVGGQGRDLLIGGFGADRIVGNADEDILIAGYTDYDAVVGALCAMMNEWTSASAYSVRVSRLSGIAGGANNGYYFTVDGITATVHDDNAADVLTGSADQDWFFANLFLSGDDASQKDRITDLNSNEFANDLDFIGG